MSALLARRRAACDRYARNYGSPWYTPEGASQELRAELEDIAAECVRANGGHKDNQAPFVGTCELCGKILG